MRTLDIPQANDLRTIRRVVKAVASEAADQAAIRDWTGFSRRHTQYRLQAARVLGLVRVDEAQQVSVTPLGERLLATEPESAAARAVWYDAVSFSRALQIIAPDLLQGRGPGLEELTTRLVEMSELSASTARRRANGLLTWRRFVLDLPDPEPPAPRAQPATQPKPAASDDAPAVDPRQLDLFG